MSLTSWRAAGWLVEHNATPEEVRELFAVAERDLKDSAVAGAKLVARLDAFRKKRNVSDYERVGLTSSKEAAELRETAKDLRDRVRSWIKMSRPELLEPK